MTNVAKAKLLVALAAALALLAAGIAFRQEILSWLGGAPAEEYSRQAMAQGTGGEEDAAAAMAQAAVYLTPEKQQLIGVRTATVVEEPVTQSIRAVGMVEIDETRITHVHTRVSGWVRRVFVDFTWQHVHQGQPLFTLYSPELVSAQQEFLIARRGREELAGSPYPEVAKSSESLLRSARERMKLWEMTEEQIAELEASGTPREELTIFSPVSGHVSVRNVFPNQFITPESDLYTIVDHTRVWVQAQLFEYELESVRVGQPASMTVAAFPGRVFRGRVAYVNPHLEMATRTLDVRLEFPNPELALKPGMFADVTLEIPLGRQVVVPSEAVLDTGARQIVFLALPDGYFESREVLVGTRLEDRLVILEGLEPGDTVVTSGAFLIDSESQLTAALGGLQAPSAPAEAAPSGPGEGAAAAQIEFSVKPSPPRVGSNELTVRLRDASAKPITDAEVSVTFFMPAMPSMGMGAMQQRATLSHAGNGEYRGRLEVPDRGNWRVTVSARRAGEPLASKQLNLVAQ